MKHNNNNNNNNRLIVTCKIFVVRPSIHIIIYIIKGVMFVCHDLCSVWPAKRLGRSRPNLTHALMSTQGVFLARSMSRSFTYACGTNRSTKHPESDTWRTMLKLRPDDGGGDTCRTITKLRSSRNEARRRRRRAASANGASRTPSGGRVIRASTILFIRSTHCVLRSYRFFTACHHSLQCTAMYWLSSRCPSVRPSVRMSVRLSVSVSITRRYCVKTIQARSQCFLWHLAPAF